MKIAIISDVHANIFGLKTVFSDLPKVDRVLCAGDITGYYPFVNEAIDFLRNKKVVCVKGNHDQYLINGKAPEGATSIVKDSVERMKSLISSENLKFINSLPDSFDAIIDGKKIFMFHGSPWDHLEERIYPDYAHFERFESVDADIIILGHTHYPLVKKIGRKTIINPGSCGQPRDYNMLSYIIWDTHKDTFENKRVEWDVENFKKEALARGTSPELFEVFNRIK